jgi:hypothetical protein
LKTDHDVGAMAPEPPEEVRIRAADRDALLEYATEAVMLADIAAENGPEVLADIALRYRTTPVFSELTTLAALHQCITDYATALRAAGIAPGAAIVPIRGMLQRALNRPRQFAIESMQTGLRSFLDGYFQRQFEERKA